jgi:hypothetical protein
MTHQPPPTTTTRTTTTVNSTTTTTNNNNNNPNNSPAAWPEPSQQPSQQLIITLIRANQLKLPATVRPYAVLQFDHTESITEQAHPPSPSPSSSSSTTTTTTTTPTPTHRTKWRPLRPNSNQINSNSTVCQLTPTNPSALDQPIWNHLAIFDLFNLRSSLFISIYYKHPTTLPSSSSTQDQPDRLLGYTIIDLPTILAQDPPINPNSDPQHKHLILDRSIDLFDQSGNQNTGSIAIKIEINQINNLIQQQQQHQPLEEKPQRSSAVKKISIDDFEIIKLIGEGSYGQVC